jgi:hypothetical protein
MTVECLQHTHDVPLQVRAAADVKSPADVVMLLVQHGS